MWYSVIGIGEDGDTVREDDGFHYFPGNGCMEKRVIIVESDFVSVSNNDVIILWQRRIGTRIFVISNTCSQIYLSIKISIIWIVKFVNQLNILGSPFMFGLIKSLYLYSLLHRDMLGPSYLKNISNIRTYIDDHTRVWSNILWYRVETGDPRFEAWNEEDAMIMACLWNFMTLEISDTCMFLDTVNNIEMQFNKRIPKLEMWLKSTRSRWRQYKTRK